LGSEFEDLLLDHPIGVHVCDLIKPHIGEIQMHIIRDPQFQCRFPGLLVLLESSVSIVWVLGGATVRYTEDAHLISPYRGMESNGSTHSEDFVVWMCGDHQDSSGHRHSSPKPGAHGNHVSDIGARARPGAFGLNLLEKEGPSPAGYDDAICPSFEDRPGLTVPTCLYWS